MSKITPNAIRIQAVMAQTGLGRSMIYKLARQDPDFPKPVKVGKATLFMAHEVDAWLTAQAAARPVSTAQ
jgi:predicted DNA-binding transcriptional regulator AlpA